MSEDELQWQVLTMARALGWRCVHIRPGRTQDGWRTPIQGDGAGWPDVFMTRGGDCLAVELKRQNGSVRPEQWAWLDALNAAGIDAIVWRPSDLMSGTIAAVLSGGRV